MDFAELTQDQQIEMEEYGATGSVDSAVTLPILETGQVTTSTSSTETVTLPNANSRFLAKFELLLTEEQVKLCEATFASGGKIESPVYSAWEILKKATLPAMEHDALEEVIKWRDLLYIDYKTISCFRFLWRRHQKI